MRSILRHALTLFVLGFICKIALQAQEGNEVNGVPKSLLLARLAPEQGLPSRKIDARPIIDAIRNQ